MPFTFLPEPLGGTELYVAELCRNLRSLSVTSVVAAPAAADAQYAIAGLAIRRFATGHDLRLEQLYGGDPVARDSFARVLDEEAPDVVHQHAFTSACSHLLIEEAQRRGIPVVLTLHTATVTCQRGSLLEGGRHPCDGRLDVARCTACTLDAFGNAPAQLLAHVPTVVGEALGRLDRRGGAWTALRMSSLLRHRHESVVSALRRVDRFVALTPWVEDLLKANGVSLDRVVRSPHGLPSHATVKARRKTVAGSPLKVVHLGRADGAKGTDVLVQAVRQAPDLNLTLDIFAVVQSAAGANVLRALQELAGNDHRIRFLAPLPPQDVVSRLATYDLVAVPSQCVETGPLVVLEAFQAGTPVLGSALGGIADKVRHEIDGLLVRPFNAVVSWCDALRRCTNDRALVDGLAAGVAAPRSAATVADEMRALYRTLMTSDADRGVGVVSAARSARS